MAKVQSGEKSGDSDQDCFVKNWNLGSFIKSSSIVYSEYNAYFWESVIPFSIQPN